MRGDGTVPNWTKFELVVLLIRSFWVGEMLLVVKEGVGEMIPCAGDRGMPDCSD